LGATYTKTRIKDERARKEAKQRDQKEEQKQKHKSTAPPASRTTHHSHKATTAQRHNYKTTSGSGRTKERSEKREKQAHGQRQPQLLQACVDDRRCSDEVPVVGS
jgi:hypothetical protein